MSGRSVDEYSINNFKRGLEKALECVVSEDNSSSGSLALTREQVDDCITCLHKLDEFQITINLLCTTKVGRVVNKFTKRSIATKYPRLAKLALALIHKWKKMYDDGEEDGNRPKNENDKENVLSEHCAMALAIFRKREAELKSQGAFKPDMTAYKELKDKWAPPKRHGSIDGVPIGLKLNGKGEAAILGIHTMIQRGIEALADEPCYAICHTEAGGYAEDNENTTDGTLFYQGSGGRDKKKQQVQDQKEDSYNRSLMIACDRKTEIRMLRGVKENGRIVYYYEGLYRCTDWTDEKKDHGFRVYTFTLKPIPGKSTRSATVSRGLSDRGRGNSGDMNARHLKGKSKRVAPDSVKPDGKRLRINATRVN